MRPIQHPATNRSAEFRKVVDVFLSQPGLPFGGVLSAERIQRVFEKHNSLFGRRAIYTTALTLWAFLGQVLRDGKLASCQSAVADVVVYQQLTGGRVPTSDTGDYCKARMSLAVEALKALALEAAAEVEEQASPEWLWKGRHVKLVDGFTFTMPDTAENQAEYPQQKGQKPGIGFPIARVCAIVSLATACVTALTLGKYAGKETGENALLRQLIDTLSPGDVLVGDRYYCSFMMIALLLGQGVDVCARMHQRRHVDFRRGKRLGKYDHLIVWNRPVRPAWMDEATYDSIPESITMREIRFHIIEPGRRTEVLTVATTLIDAETYTKEDIAGLYGYRWNSELDIRSIKTSLNLDHVRCKSPAMVHRELWTTLLGYNLIRTTAATAAAAALLHNCQAREISFTATCQMLLAGWMPQSALAMPVEELRNYCSCLLFRISQCRVGHRPGRIEPRVLKRRRHGYPLMKEPRRVFKAKHHPSM